MFFKQLATRDASLSYLFGCIGHAKAIAVDVVAGDEVWFIKQAEAMSVTIAYVVDTHVHADHISGGRTLAAKVGAPYCMHEAARASVGFEKRWNAALTMDRAAFVAAVRPDIPPRPAQMDEIVAANTAA